jgi:hypothetical protein
MNTTREARTPMAFIKVLLFMAHSNLNRHSQDNRVRAKRVSLNSYRDIRHSSYADISYIIRWLRLPSHTASRRINRRCGLDSPCTVSANLNSLASCNLELDAGPRLTRSVAVDHKRFFVLCHALLSSLGLLMQQKRLLISRAETQLSWFPRTKMIPRETFPLQFLN